MDTPVDFTREELWQLADRAHARASEVANPHWQRAYSDLEYACNVLDAHLARSSVAMAEVLSTIKEGR